jgi:hypothetical protein
MWKRSMWMRHALFSLALLSPSLSHATSSTSDASSEVSRDIGSQPHARGPAHGRERRHAKLSPEERAAKKREIAQKVDTLLVVELSTRLKLSDDKTLKLKSALQQNRDAREARRATIEGERTNLRALVDKSASDGELLAQSKKLAALINDKGDVDLFEQTAKFLTPKEQAQLMLTLPELRQEVRGLAREARGHRRGKGEGRELQDMDREERFERGQRRDRSSGPGRR